MFDLLFCLVVTVTVVGLVAFSLFSHTVGFTAGLRLFALDSPVTYATHGADSTVTFPVDYAFAFGLRPFARLHVRTVGCTVWFAHTRVRWLLLLLLLVDLITFAFTFAFGYARGLGYTCWFPLPLQLPGRLHATHTTLRLNCGLFGLICHLRTARAWLTHTRLRLVCLVCHALVQLRLRTPTRYALVCWLRLRFTTVVASSAAHTDICAFITVLVPSYG